jgi:hypothetical protein
MSSGEDVMSASGTEVRLDWWCASVGSAEGYA